MYMKKQPTDATRLSSFIIMSYKEQCKSEGVILTKIKVIRAVLSGMSQIEASLCWQCSKNTIGAIMSIYAKLPEDQRSLIRHGHSFTNKDLEQFAGLRPLSRAPHGHSRSLSFLQEQVILDLHKTGYGPYRMYTHLKRSGESIEIYTLAKIRGCYRRHDLTVKKVRTVNRESRPLYDYSALAAFERLHMDTKHILDVHALPTDIYDKFRDAAHLPIYQWTIIDAKTRIRFLAYSHELSSFFGQRFLLFTIEWLRAHGILLQISVLFDGGAEFCSASPKKLADWQTFFDPFGVTVEHTDGDKTRQNLVERSHRSDDEEFYCPRGPVINTKSDFLIEAQKWNIYWNCYRPHQGIDNLTPAEKLAGLGYTNASAIGHFPTLVLEDFYRELIDLPNFMAKQPKVVIHRIRSQNVLTYYRELVSYRKRLGG